MFLQSLVNFVILFLFEILPLNSGDDQKKKKKVFVAFWFYLSSEFWIFSCQVGITCQKTEGARNISFPSVSDVRGRRPLAPQKSTPMAENMLLFLSYY